MSKKNRGPIPMPRGPVPTAIPTRTPITDGEGLKFRIVKLKETINALNRIILDKDQVICSLKEQLFRYEEEKDIGSLNLREGDNVMLEDGKYYIERRGGVPQAPPTPSAPPPAPPIPTEKGHGEKVDGKRAGEDNESSPGSGGTPAKSAG
jgi:hypothetical protein